MTFESEHCVTFNGNNLTFDFINLDVNSVLKLYDHNINRLNTILEMLDVDIETSIQENPYFQSYFRADQFSNFVIQRRHGDRRNRRGPLRAIRPATSEKGFHSPCVETNHELHAIKRSLFEQTTIGV